MIVGDTKKKLFMCLVLGFVFVSIDTIICRLVGVQGLSVNV